MKKFIIKILVIMIPLIVVLGTTYITDPYDYWGKYQDNRGFHLYTPVPRMRNFLIHPEKIVLIGDSRSAEAYLYDDKLNDINYNNLSFGGAGIEDCIEMFWFVVENKEIDKVVFQISFHTMNLNYTDERVKSAIKTATSPLNYYFDYKINMECIKQAITLNIKGNGGEDLYVRPVATKESMDNYVKEILIAEEGYILNLEAITKLEEIAIYCDENNIELVFITPPLYIDIWAKVIKPLELFDEMDEYKAGISKFAKIYDFEYQSEISSSNDFIDGFHFADELYIDFLRAGLADELDIDFVKVLQDKKE